MRLVSRYCLYSSCFLTRLLKDAAHYDNNPGSTSPFPSVRLHPGESEAPHIRPPLAGEHLRAHQFFLRGLVLPAATVCPSKSPQGRERKRSVAGTQKRAVDRPFETELLQQRIGLLTPATIRRGSDRGGEEKEGETKEEEKTWRAPDRSQQPHRAGDWPASRCMHCGQPRRPYMDAYRCLLVASAVLMRPLREEKSATTS